MDRDVERRLIQWEKVLKQAILVQQPELTMTRQHTTIQNCTANYV